MSISRFAAVSLFAVAFLISSCSQNALVMGGPAPNKANGPQQPVQDNKVNLTVVKHDDHVQFNCVPANSDTASRSDWKDTCNRMAVKQAVQLSSSGMIAPLQGPVFDSSTPGDTLSRHVPLSQTHL